MGVSSVITSSVDGTESTRSRPSHSHTVLSDGGLLKLRRRLPLLLVRPLAARPLFGLAGRLCESESIFRHVENVFQYSDAPSKLMRNLRSRAAVINCADKSSQVKSNGAETTKQASKQGSKQASKQASKPPQASKPVSVNMGISRVAKGRQTRRVGHDFVANSRFREQKRGGQKATLRALPSFFNRSRWRRPQTMRLGRLVRA